MYSFLPTRIRIAAPLVIHVPFKLDGSREFVDPQGRNLWFRHTVTELEEFLKVVYVHLAHEVKQDIVEYLPRKHTNLFKQDNEKVKCLRTNDFMLVHLVQNRSFAVRMDHTMITAPMSIPSACRQACVAGRTLAL